MPFTKGDPNINRKGRPKGISITEMVKKALEEVEPKTNTPWKDLITKKILLKAVSEGDTQMLKAIWAYIDGMPKQSNESTNYNMNKELDDNRPIDEQINEMLDQIEDIKKFNNG